MSVLLLKLNMAKIIEEDLFTGKKGVYLDAVVLLKDAPDQFGNFGVILQESKEDGIPSQRRPILGNARWGGRSNFEQKADPGKAYKDAEDAQKLKESGESGTGQGEDMGRVPF